MFGLSIAYACAKRGATVRVIDPHGPGAGASGGLVGALAPHTPDDWKPKKQLQLDGLLMSRDFWPRIELETAMPSGYRQAGRLQPILNDRGLGLAQSRQGDALQRWGDHATWAVLDHAPDPDWAPPSPTGHYIHDTLSAIINPRLAVLALAEAVEGRASTITQDGPITGQVVEATGTPGLKEITENLGRFYGHGEKGQAALLDHDARDMPQLFADGIHFIPHGNGTTAIGSTTERYFDDPTSTDIQLDHLIQKARDLLPALRSAKILNRWANTRPRSVTRAPILGRHPLRPDRFIANGGFKIGLALAPMIGEMMADLVLDGKNTIPPALDAIAALPKS